MTNFTKQRAELMQKLWTRWFDGIPESELRLLVDDLCKEYQAITDREIESFMNRVKERDK